MLFGGCEKEWGRRGYFRASDSLDYSFAIPQWHRLLPLNIIRLLVLSFTSFIARTCCRDLRCNEIFDTAAYSICVENNNNERVSVTGLFYTHMTTLRVRLVI